MSNQKTVKLPIAWANRVRDEFPDMADRVAFIERALAHEKLKAVVSIAEQPISNGVLLEPAYVKFAELVETTVVLPFYMASLVSQAAGRVEAEGAGVWLKVAQAAARVERDMKEARMKAQALASAPEVEQ